MMRAWLVGALLAGPALAQEIPPPAMSPPDAWVAKGAATLRVMNKIDSTVQTVTVKAGAQMKYQTLTLKVASCYVRPDDLPADATAKLTVAEDGAASVLFDGWILQKEPALNMLEHPVYDIQLAGCAS